MTECVFYNLASTRGRARDRAAARARAPRRPARRLPAASSSTTASIRSSPGTTPTLSTCARRLDGRGQRDAAARTSIPATYRSDSNQHWRSGCPHEELAAGEFPWLQLLTHPEIWAYQGETMGETMRAMLEAERGARSRAARRRPDRPDVKPLTIVVTASGAPGTAALLRGLRENGERERRLVGTDMSELAIGRHLCDAFHVVPAGSDPGFADAMLDDLPTASASTRCCRSRRSTCSALAERSERFADRRCSSRRPRRSAARTTRPRPTRCSTDRRARARPGGGSTGRGRGRRRGARARLPGADVCLQAGVLLGVARLPHRSSATADRARPAAHERPGVAEAMRLEELVELLPAEGGPELLVMELAAGGERTIDGIADGGGSCSATRRRARRCAPVSPCTSSRSTTRR